MCKQFSNHYNKRIKAISVYFELQLRGSTSALSAPSADEPFVAEMANDIIQITSVRRKAEVKAKIIKF